MLISQRQAAALLGHTGYGYGESCRLLRAGLAGDPVRTSSALLYEEARVRELGARTLPPRPLPEACRRGIFVLRGAGTTVDGSFRMHFALRLAHMIHVERAGAVPLVHTISGLVAATYDVTAVVPHGRDRARLSTRPAGEWAAAFESRVWPTVRGPVLVWDGRPPWEGLGKR